MKTLKKFFDDINRIANLLAFRSINVEVTLCPEDRELLANFRRYKPREKKETAA